MQRPRGHTASQRTASTRVPIAHTVELGTAASARRRGGGGGRARVRPRVPRFSDARALPHLQAQDSRQLARSEAKHGLEVEVLNEHLMLVSLEVLVPHDLAQQPQRRPSARASRLPFFARPRRRSGLCAASAPALAAGAVCCLAPGRQLQAERQQDARPSRRAAPLGARRGLAEVGVEAT